MPYSALLSGLPIPTRALNGMALLSADSRFFEGEDLMRAKYLEFMRIRQPRVLTMYPELARFAKANRAGLKSLTFELFTAMMTRQAEKQMRDFEFEVDFESGSEEGSKGLSTWKQIQEHNKDWPSNHMTNHWQQKILNELHSTNMSERRNLQNRFEALTGAQILFRPFQCYKNRRYTEWRKDYNEQLDHGTFAVDYIEESILATADAVADFEQSLRIAYRNDLSQSFIKWSNWNCSAVIAIPTNQQFALKPIMALAASTMPACLINLRDSNLYYRERGTSILLNDQIVSLYAQPALVWKQTTSRQTIASGELYESAGQFMALLALERSIVASRVNVGSGKSKLSWTHSYLHPPLLKLYKPWARKVIKRFTNAIENVERRI